MGGGDGDVYSLGLKTNNILIPVLLTDEQVCFNYIVAQNVHLLMKRFNASEYKTTPSSLGGINLGKNTSYSLTCMVLGS